MASFGARHRLIGTVVGTILMVLPGAVALPAPASAAAQKTFATPEQAVAALVAAVRSGHSNDVLAILGPNSKKLVSSGDPVADAQARHKFTDAYDEKNHIERDGDDRALLEVGQDDWPFPFPIVKHGATWQFDAAAGASEIVARRIGANELFTIEVCRAYVDGQREYAQKDRNHDGYVEYAQKFLSSPGKQDGLYWPAAAGEEESPLGPLIADARAEGYGAADKKAGPQPFHGYYYRILKGQGPAARGGAYAYVLNGHMIGGFALVAFPAQYGVSGVMTFIVNHDDVVYQKDLGPRTADLARKMTLFDPDSSWKPVP
ncbi:MAG TPA: DUF2950 domain-containing protein [Alphaproteobacteria bacterium]|nr:DUF2950 domain-containing protein [Alphaproteobacteria bacterium]